MDLLAEANRRRPSAEIRRALIDLRHAAASQVSSFGRSPWPPRYADPFPEVVGVLPEVTRSGLDAPTLGGAVAHHGCLVVRGLFTPDQAKAGIEAIERADAARNSEGEHDPDWYRPVEGVSDKDRSLRRRVGSRGGTWLADSPAATALVLDELDRAGAIGAIAEHFGERPWFSLQKSTLRRSAPVFDFASWHQDGSFLGPTARAMNVWVALTPCGGGLPTPSMEVIPRRVEEILPCDGGMGTASISEDTARRGAEGTEAIVPGFEAGDAMIFDERFLHRTHLMPVMTETRYALECWFFAPAFGAEQYRSYLA